MDELLEEVPHLVAAKSDLVANRIADASLVCGDGFLGAAAR